MSDYEFSLMVYIGRFQPLHNGHINTIRLALQKTRRLIILVGSHQAPLTARNPWTSEERMALIRGALDEEEYNRCLVAGLEDFTYQDEKWVKRIKEIVQGFKAIYGGADCKIGITGFDKDSTSYYLKLFPEWETSLKPQIERIGATDIRNAYFDHGTVLTDVLPANVSKFLIDFKQDERFEYLVKEHDYCKEYRKATQVGPFPVIIHTVDNVVEDKSGRVLLVKRGGQPGLGLWALPGGHLDLHETLRQAAVRELVEETGVSAEGYQSEHTFDEPNRSNRGRCITTAFHWKLDQSVVQAEAGDDAADARWFTTYELQRRRSEIHEDHYHIIDYFLDLKLVS